MMTRSVTRIQLSWQDIETDCRSLAATLAARGPFCGMVAVTRGGLAPAAVLANLLDIRRVETIAISSYQDDRQTALTMLTPLPIQGDGAGWLVVDDLVDSGATYALLRGHLPQAHFATLYAKPQGKDQTHSFVRGFPQDSWLEFPWEISGV